MHIHEPPGSPARTEARCSTRVDRAVTWPISSLALIALVDLGMSDDCIGHYYAVSSDEVSKLRHRYAECRKHMVQRRP